VTFGQTTDLLHRWRETGGWKLSVVCYLGYNPQLLLTDQRTERVEWTEQPFGQPIVGLWSGRRINPQNYRKD